MRLFSSLSVAQRAVVAIVLCLAFSSCGDDDPVTPEPGNEFFPLAQGDWQVDKVTLLDASNQPDSVYMDSVVLKAKVSIGGKSDAYQADMYNAEGAVYATTHYSNEGDAAYRFFAPVEFDGLSTFAFTPRWVKIGDFRESATSWPTLDTSLVDMPLQVGATSATGTGTIKQIFEKKPARNIALADGQTVSALEFISTTSFNFTVTAMSSDIPVVFNAVERWYYTKEMGLVKRSRDTYTINLVVTQVPVLGFETVMKTQHKN